MAILNRNVILVGLGLLGGCAVVSALLGTDDAPLAFSHRVHVMEQGMDCEACHEDAWYEDAAGWPWQDTCLVCHDDLDADRPEERRIEFAFLPDEDGRLAYASHSALAHEVIFSHLAHVQAEVGCAECHVGLEDAERVGPEHAVDMASCIRCHEERAQPAACETCHHEIDQDWLPPNHTLGWERAHGHAFRMCAGDAAQECSTCHDERSCAECHQVTPPRNHNNTFRTRTHGFHAALDRDGCATCHEPDTCTQCHLTTTPRSHTPATFGGTRSRHCLGCHLPLQDNGCSVCHPGTPSHALASPMPDWHHPAMNCRQCHGITAPLPHVDKGDDCNACHH